MHYRLLSDLVPELGGQPLRNIIITTWRSGSTFLGDILNSHPGNYYHYEPLLDYDIVQIRGPPHADSALGVLRSLLNCSYTGLSKYYKFCTLSKKCESFTFQISKNIMPSESMLL